ncbi:CcdB family protein [Roseomonas sp. CCTCC AB2023176]|uniref:CcdB family protein n=1 Tax=Roseomonas sp. CCTCC AB2023176 TaxID=3342640 RepID=UPI0035DDC523
MARFDVHSFPGGGRRGYLLDVQADLLDGIATRIVVPLLPPDATPVIMPDLNPTFAIATDRVVMATTQMASVPRRELGRTVGNLEAERDAITRALDLLLTGL